MEKSVVGKCASLIVVFMSGINFLLLCVAVSSTFETNFNFVAVNYIGHVKFISRDICVTSFSSNCDYSQLN